MGEVGDGWIVVEGRVDRKVGIGICIFLYSFFYYHGGRECSLLWGWMGVSEGGG
jgi:hypothetical protein